MKIYRLKEKANYTCTRLQMETVDSLIFDYNAEWSKPNKYDSSFNQDGIGGTVQYKVEEEGWKRVL